MDLYEERLRDVRRFYRILDSLESKLGGVRTLAEATGKMEWPRRGVYFFFEPGDLRATSGDGPRVVRVGTHALKAGAKTTLWQRLRQHRGSLKSGGGNHRGSVFRLHVGSALINRDDWPAEIAGDWGIGSSASKEIRDRERPLEQALSKHIRSMPFLWAKVDDEPGPDSLRGCLERNAIALLSNSNFQEKPIDPPSRDWLGSSAKSESIRRSGLWNVNHVADDYDPDFLDWFERHVEAL